MVPRSAFLGARAAVVDLGDERAVIAEVHAVDRAGPCGDDA